MMSALHSKPLQHHSGRVSGLYEERLRQQLARMNPRTLGWVSSLLVAVFAGILRFVRLGSPKAIVFDETYYVKDAWSMLMTGEARDWPEKFGAQGTPIDQLFASGQTDLWLSSAEYVVHPPVGKWCIALGLRLFGGASNPFAWRATTAFAGCIAVLLLCRVALRLFHNLPIALAAGFLLAIDGLGITMSRVGLLDNFIMLFVLAAFACLLAHRDWAQSRLREAFQQAKQDRVELHSSGPFIAFSWWRLAAAFFLGLATGTKWSGAYFFAVFAFISVIWDAYERHTVGYRSWFFAAIVKDGLPAALCMIPTWVATYLFSWMGWFIHPDSYMHNWASTHPHEGILWLPDSLRSFVEYHVQMWQFHTTLESSHPYMANPLTWPLQIRPTAFYWETLPDHPGLCQLSPNFSCVASITSLGNPLVWWLASICFLMGILVACWFRRGDWRFLAVSSGLLGGWLPWAQYLHRTTFTFYSIVILPWMILSICYLAVWFKENVTAAVYRQTFLYCLGLMFLVSVFFYPLWTAIPVPYNFWSLHMWLPTWI